MENQNHRMAQVGTKISVLHGRDLILSIKHTRDLERIFDWHEKEKKNTYF